MRVGSRRGIRYRSRKTKHSARFVGAGGDTPMTEARDDPEATPEFSSLPLLVEEMRTEALIQQRHWEAIDSKAAAIVGLAAGVVALAATAQSWWLLPGQVAAATAAWLALQGAAPRDMPLLNLDGLRREYLTAAPAKTRLELFDWRADQVNRIHRLLDGKAGRLRSSIQVLMAAGALLVIGSLGDLIGGR
jgi:hypothetical protein